MLLEQPWHSSSLLPTAPEPWQGGVGLPFGSNLSLAELSQSVPSSRGVELGAGQVLAAFAAAGSQGPVFVIQLHG